VAVSPGAGQKTGFAFETDFIGAVEVISHNRFARGQRLRSARGKRSLADSGQTIHDADINAALRRAAPSR